MADEIETLLTGVLSEQTFKKRLVELTAESKRLAADREQYDLAFSANHAILVEIQREQKGMEEARNDIKAREDKLAADTETLRKTIAHQNDESNRWMAHRMAVDKQQNDREIEQKKVADAQAATDGAHRRTSLDLARRTDDLREGELRHATAAKHARALLETLGG
jgi:hypothetical protein